MTKQEKHMVRHLALGLALVFFASCSTVRQPPLTFTERIEAPFDTVWRNSRSTLSERQLPIVHANPGAGELETVWVNIDDTSCGSRQRVVPCRVKYFLKVLRLGKRSTAFTISYDEDCQLDPEKKEWIQMKCDNRAFQLMDSIALDVKHYSVEEEKKRL